MLQCNTAVQPLQREYLAPFDKREVMHFPNAMCLGAVMASSDVRAAFGCPLLTHGPSALRRSIYGAQRSFTTRPAMTKHKQPHRAGFRNQHDVGREEVQRWRQSELQMRFVCSASAQHVLYTLARAGSKVRISE